jgi:hypothetical protein
MPRLTYLAGLALLLVASAFLLTDRLLTPAPGVTAANARRIKPGMSWAWVERVLGGPATQEGRLPLDGSFGAWDTGARVVLVEFDAAGRVREAASLTGYRAELSRLFLTEGRLARWPLRGP